MRNFTKIRRVGVATLHVDGTETDRQTEDLA
jgi:hypothetical protein